MPVTLTEQIVYYKCREKKAPQAIFIISGVKKSATGNFSSFGLSWTHWIFQELSDKR